MLAKRFLPILIVVSLAVGFTGGFYYRNYKTSAPVLKDIINRDVGQPQGVDFSTFWTVWNMLQSKYVDKTKLNTQNLIYGAIDGMVKAIGDPYTVFFQPVESEQFAQQINGSFSGVGIELGLRKNILTVIAPIKDSPAAKAGLVAGDKIVKINDKTTDGMIIDDAVNTIRGPKGTQVKLTIARDNVSGTKDYTLTRDNIKIPAIDWKIVDNDTAYISLSIFNQNLDSEFDKAAHGIASSKAKRIILDLRNDPGGLLDSAVNVASYFLDSNQVVTIERFSDNTENQYKTEPNGLLKSYPIVILLNKGSASASEILAGALKDDRGVLIVGETSFGKGSVQELENLPQKASVKITVAKWYTPKGVSINENGIKPDVSVTITDADIQASKDPQLDKAKELVKNLK
jgi:carboxyl-terminal processing protease